MTDSASTVTLDPADFYDHETKRITAALGNPDTRAELERELSAQPDAADLRGLNADRVEFAPSIREWLDSCEADMYETSETDGVHTVIMTDENGERLDLNASGEPCVSVAELSEFIRELRGQGAFSETTERRLLTEI